jgi:hypothetical protein
MSVPDAGLELDRLFVGIGVSVADNRLLGISDGAESPDGDTEND